MVETFGATQGRNSGNYRDERESKEDIVMKFGFIMASPAKELQASASEAHPRSGFMSSHFHIGPGQSDVQPTGQAAVRAEARSWQGAKAGGINLDVCVARRKIASVRARSSVG